MDKDIETLVTALYVKIDDEYGGIQSFGRPPKLAASDPKGQNLHLLHSTASSGATYINLTLRARGALKRQAETVNKLMDSIGQACPGPSHRHPW